MIDESVAAADADLGVIGKKRGGPFVFTDAKPYVDAVNGMKPGAGQSKEVFDLHVQSVNAHYDILNKISVNDTIRPEDDPFVEHYQTPPILEILYDADPAFKASMWKFIDALAANKALLGREAARILRRHVRPDLRGGLCLLRRLDLQRGEPHPARSMDIPKDHKRTILASKSWGMNTSYGLGCGLPGALESGKTAGRGGAGRSRYDAVHLPRADGGSDPVDGRPTTWAGTAATPPSTPTST